MIVEKKAFIKSQILCFLIIAGICCGCRPSDETAVKEILVKLQPGMSREQVDGVLGKWGRRHFWKMEQSCVSAGRTEKRQREFEVKKRGGFKILVPDNLLKIIPLADGATSVSHYVFNKRSRFAVGYEFEDLMLFYAAESGKLAGYGYNPLRVAGRSDLAGMDFFYHESCEE